MAFRPSRTLLPNGTYHSSLLTLFRAQCCSKRLISHTFSSIPTEYKYRQCVKTVLECYQARPWLEVMKNKSVSLDQQVKNDAVFPVVLTARPDEFEKLPPKCTACGAILQSKKNNQIGYINEVKFLDSLQSNMLDKLVCYSCFRLRYHNSLTHNKRVDPSDAMDQLRHIRQKKALILYVVDMFDIEGTMLRNILQLVGKNKRLIIVGNKIDRIPQDDKKPAVQLERMKDVLKEISYENGLENCNFRDICLVSARSGFGLKTLVDKVNKHREDFMDVYLVGCTNTGKSTLYNLLLNMLNVHKSDELPAQAIEHHFPGTTSSLLRESISRQKLERLAIRLEKGPWETEETFNFDQELLDLIGVKDDDSKYKAIGVSNHKEKRTLLDHKRNAVEPYPLEFVDEHFLKRKERKGGCFIYDTPGILNHSQIIKYLSSADINYLSPTRWVVPRTFILKPGNCLFVGGLARLDYDTIEKLPLENFQDDTMENRKIADAAKSIYVTVMVSPNVPIHVTITETADEKFEKLFSNNVLELPKGSPEKFKEYPKLVPHEYTIIGKDRNTNACDLVLHGIGWLSISAVLDSRVKMALHTPNGEGQSLRLKPFLPYTVRRKFGRGLPYRGHLNQYMYSHTRKRSPQFIRLFQQQNDPVYLWKAKVKQKMKQDRFQKKEDKRLERLEKGIVLGKMKAIKEKEEMLSLREPDFKSLLGKGK